MSKPVSSLTPAEYVELARHGDNPIGAGGKLFWDATQDKTIEARRANPSLDYKQTRYAFALLEAQRIIDMQKTVESWQKGAA